ncbi:MAG: alanyl-tRNA editing protein [Burkholderiaceae bacterium]
MTRALFRTDAYRTECEARITALDEQGIELDCTVFYPLGGGQAGDRGHLLLGDGSRIAIGDTRKARREGATPDDAVHVPVDTADLARVRAGDRVTAMLDWAYRHRLMRFHTTTHLLCALIPQPVNGCSITADYARIDFDIVEPLDRDALQAGLERLVAAGHPCTLEWITDDELLANPEMVRTMSVKPPLGFGRVRLLRIGDIDLQPCGGTHVANTREIGAVRIAKIEKKSARTRRITLRIDDGEDS